MTAKKAQKKTGTPKKQTFCKEFDCSQTAQVAGYCRLHFLKLVKGKSQAASPAAAERPARESKERRRSNRLLGLDAVGDDNPAPLDMVENMGNIDIDINTIVNVDDSELPAPQNLDTEGMPLKKTGS